MPKNPIDYSKTQIYKWVCNDPNINSCYVGHTTNWVKRKASHKERCNGEKTKKYHLQIYQIMRTNGGIENWNMILIEDFPCINRREAEKREQYWKDELKADMNTYRAYRTEEEMKLQKYEQLKKWRIENPNKTKEYNMKYKYNG